MDIEATGNDDFIYEKLLKLLEQIKLVQGGTALSSTIRRHNKIKTYLIEKQIARIKYIEEKYFDEEGVKPLQG